MRILSAVLLTCGLSASTFAADSLSETFDELPQATGVTSVGAFHTINATNVDVVGPVNYPGLCRLPESGNCVDMNGSVQAGPNPSPIGQLPSNNVFPAGNYLLSFQLIGSGRGQTASVTVKFGNYTQIFTLTTNDTTTGIVVNQPVTLAQPGVLEFDSNTSGPNANIGLLLDNVFVVPAEVQVSYAANLGAGPSVVNITNVGANGGFEPAGNICANVYVFAEDQQLIACCSCLLTPNHLRTLSVQSDLISNTLTPGVPVGVTIALVASQPVGGACDASRVTPATLTDGMRAWSTTLHAAPRGGFAVTENHFLRAPLGNTFAGNELDKMTSYCSFIEANGSGYGICGSCRTGAAGGQKQ